MDNPAFFTEKICELMRSYGEKSEQLHKISRFLNTNQALTVAAGGGGWDAWVDAAVIDEFLSNIRIEQDINKTAELTKKWARYAIKLHNSKRVKDINWRRAETHLDSKIEAMQRAFLVIETLNK